MPHSDNTISTRIRNDDHAAAIQVTRQVPVRIVDVIAAWRRLWESVPEKQRQAALQRVAADSAAA